MDRQSPRTSQDKCLHIRISAEAIRRRKLLERKEHLERYPDEEREDPIKFTQEYVFERCPAYKRIAEKQAKEVPAEEVIRDLADVLECGVKQRNELLREAGYQTDPVYLEGDALRKAIQLSQKTMDYIPFPAYIIMRDWSIVDINEYLLTFFKVNTDDFNKLNEDERNILHLIFDKTQPTWRRLGAYSPMWYRIAKHNIFGFKLANQMYQYDDFYLRRVRLLHKLPKFKELWDDVTIDNYNGSMEYETELDHPDVGIVTFRSLMITHSDFVAYPQIIAYIPRDSSDEKKFAAIGLPVKSGNWP